MISKPQGERIECYGPLTRRVSPDGEERLIYLGYPLRLSPDESRLLRVLLIPDGHPTDAQGYRSVSTVLAALRASTTAEHPLTDEERLAIFFGQDSVCPDMPYSPGQIANLVCRINRKARAIGGRPLILGKSHHGYRVNPYM